MFSPFYTQSTVLTDQTMYTRADTNRGTNKVRQFEIGSFVQWGNTHRGILSFYLESLIQCQFMDKVFVYEVMHVTFCCLFFFGGETFAVLVQ